MYNPNSTTNNSIFSVDSSGNIDIDGSIISNSITIQNSPSQFKFKLMKVDYATSSSDDTYNITVTNNITTT